MGLRNKLVSNLKEKEIKKMKECGDKIRNDKLYSDGEESREEISDDEEDNTSRSPRDRDDRRDRDERRHRIALAKERKVEKLYSSEGEGDLDQVSEEDLRLTSSSDNDEEGNGTEDKKKKRKKEKKKKKKKEKERKKITHRDLLGIEMTVGIEMSVVIASPSQKKEKSRNFILLKGKGTWIKYQRKIFA